MISSGPLPDDHWVRGGVVPEDRDWGADPSAVAAIPCTPYRDVAHARGGLPVAFTERLVSFGDWLGGVSRA